MLFDDFALHRFGWNNLLFILLVLFILFGHRLPAIMRANGRGKPWL
jgi:Sec-independent protein translocase protein TatA